MDKEMRWLDYIEQNKIDGLFFLDVRHGIYVQVFEGTGENLLPEDEENGFVDYWISDVYTGEGMVGGGQLLLTSVIREDNPTIREIIKLITDNAEIFDVVGLDMNEMLLDAKTGIEIGKKYWGI